MRNLLWDYTLICKRHYLIPADVVPQIIDVRAVETFHRVFFRQQQQGAVVRLVRLRQEGAANVWSRSRPTRTKPSSSPIAATHPVAPMPPTPMTQFPATSDPRAIPTRDDGHILFRL